MYKELDGYHAYYKYPNYTSPYESLHTLVQLASALYWKKNFGKIHLVCNQGHLDVLKIYGVDKVYDSIDLTVLDDMGSVDMRYWSLAKIHLANHLAKTKQRFCIVDTDLWMRKVPTLFDLSADLLGLHMESFDPEDGMSSYQPPADFIPYSEEEKYDWDVLPLNCGVIYLNNPALVRAWYHFAMATVDRNRYTPHLMAIDAVETIFIEQRVLPTMAVKFGCKVGTIIPSTYHTALNYRLKDGPADNFVPSFTSSPEMEECFANIKHVWGLKKQFADPNVRRGVSTQVLNNLEEDGFDLSEFSKLLEDNII